MEGAVTGNEGSDERPKSKNRAAKELKVSNRRFDAAIASGDVKIVYFGGRPFVSPAELRRLRDLLK
jgi:hypothetical protein